jgi:hypothetical protein
MLRRVSIRTARVEDAPNIAIIHVHSWRAAYRGIVPDEFLAAISLEKREENWRLELTKSDGRVWVAEDDGVMKGGLLPGRAGTKA